MRVSPNYIPQIGKYVGQPTTLNLSVSSGSVQLLPSSYYRIWSSVNAFFVFDSNGTTAATTSSNPLTAGLDILHYTGQDGYFLQAVVASGTGVLYASLINTIAN